MPASPDVIASTPKASVTSNAVRISSRAKGLSKTVSLSTPRRRKKKGESSDESSKPNDPASSKDKQSKKPIPIPNKKDASSSDGKGDNTQIKNPAVPDEKKKQRSSRISGKAQESDTGKVSDSDGSASKGNKGTNRKPGKVKESSMPEIVQVVSGDERSTVRTRSIRSNDAGKHNDQNKTEIEQRGKGGEENGMDNTDEMKKGRDNRSMDESGLGRSIDSGLGKSMDIQDLTMEDGHVKKGEHVKKEELVKKEGHVKCLQDISQDEPTVIHATQTFSQEGMDDHTHLDDEVFSKDLDEDTLSVIAKKSGVDDGAKDVNVDVDRDSSSGPFTKASVSEKTISKRKERGVEQDKGESSTPYKKKTTKPVKAKAGAKTRQIRTRAAAKKNASVGSSVSTSESDITITKQTSKARAKSAEPGSKASKAITSSRSVSDLDKRNKLGSGYNTEDWMMDYSDLERRTERKKALENASNVSKSRLSLISTVYRENYRTDYKFKRKKFENPYEFKTSPPAKRSPQGKKLLRPALRTYQLKKQAELQQKREKKGNKADKLLSYNDDEEMPEMKENEKSFSDIALEVQRKHRERELRKHDSESDILNRRRDSEPDEQSTTEILNDWKEKSKTRRNLEQGAFKKVEENEQNKENEKDGEGTTPVEAGDVLDPPADGIDSSQTLRFDDQQVLANVTAEPDQESLDGDSLSNLLKTIRDDKPAGFEENVKKNTEDHVEKNGVRRTKDKEIIDKERDKKAMENHEGEDKESSRKTNDESENLTKKSKRDTSLDRLVPPGIQNSLMDEESKMLLNHVFGRDDEDGDLWIGAKENKNQVDTSRSQRGTKPRANSNHENPAQTSARDTNTDRARGKQKSTGEEIVELDEIFDDGNGDSLLEPKQTKRNTAKRTRSASDNTARLPGEKQEAGRGDILEEDDVYADESADELEEMSPRPAKKRIPRDRKYVKEHKDGEGDLSSGTALILDAFKKNFERIIEDSDDCVDLPTKTNKSSTSRKQSETISKNKKTVKSSKRRESPLREDHLYHPHEPSKFEASTPQAKLSRSTDSGFFDKTLSSSSKKRTPSSAKGDVQDKTPGGTVSRKSRRFGCLDVQSTGHTPRRGYHSNDDKRTSRIQEEYESGEEDCNLFSHSQPASINQGSRKRKGSRERETGFKSESKMQKRNKGSAKDDDFEYPDSITELIKGMDDQDYVNESFKTPVDNQSMPIQPRKLFQSSDHSAPRKRQKVSRERQRANDDDEDDDDEDIENPFDDEDSIGEEMQTSFINLGKEVKKTIKQRQDYVSQIASATMKLITAKSEEMWSKQSSRRHTLMNEFTSCVNKYVEDHQQITSKRQQIEDDMITQVKNHLEALAKQRKEQEKCLRGIIKTQKAFTETFKSIEDAEQSQRMDFLDSLRKELKRYRDQAAQEVQKQEFENIKRRIQAMLGMSL
ncbi:Hypothetical predicted protein [Paramuricea clavata]|uniref:Uncharacterized protein n=1 Tax=Paramuricea clavata TaxID=317549 RepID=A0A6S7GXY2_PARCT|nr:Hypothetical predicted protein [Paramuricea clavata]